MYVIRGKTGKMSVTRLTKTMKDAIALADEMMEDGYKDVAIQGYSGQLALFDGECHEEG